MSASGSLSQLRIDGLTRLLAIGLILAIASHNLEEGLTFPLYPETIATVQQWALLPVKLPDWNQMQLALIFATIAPAAIIAWSLSRPATSVKAGMIAMLAALMLANALVPHLVLTMYLASYTPGAITALLVNIPCCAALLAVLRCSGLLTARQWVLACILGVIALPIALVGILGLSGALLG